MSDPLDDEETQMVSWPQEEETSDWSDVEEQRCAVNADDSASQDLFSGITSSRPMNSALQEDNEEDDFSPMDDALLSENMIPCSVNLRPISPEKTPENWTVPRFNFLSPSTQGGTPESRRNFVYPAANSLESQLHLDVKALAAKYSQQTATSCGITQSQQAAVGRKVTQSQQLTVDPLQFVHSSQTTDDDTQFSGELEYISSDATDATILQDKNSSPKKVTAECTTDTVISAPAKRKFKFVRVNGNASQSGEQQQECRKVTGVQKQQSDGPGVQRQDGKPELALSSTQVIPASYDITENLETQFLQCSQKPDSVDMRIISQELDALTDLNSQDILSSKNSTSISDTASLCEPDAQLAGTPKTLRDINTISSVTQNKNSAEDDKLITSPSSTCVSQEKTIATSVSDPVAELGSMNCTKENINEHVLALLEFLDQPVSVTSPASAVSLSTPESTTATKTKKKNSQKKTTPKQIKNTTTPSRKRNRSLTETTPGTRKSPRLLNNLSKKVEQQDCDENTALNILCESEKGSLNSGTDENINLHSQKKNKQVLAEIISVNKTLEVKQPVKKKRKTVARKTLDEFDSEKLRISMEEMVRKGSGKHSNSLFTHQSEEIQDEATAVTSHGETTKPKTTRRSTSKRGMRKLSDYSIFDEIDQQENENRILVDKQNSVSSRSKGNPTLSNTEKTEASTKQSYNSPNSEEKNVNNRKKRSSPKWLSKYSAIRNSKKKAANKEETIPQAVAVVNLFTRSYGKSRKVVESPPPVCTRDTSVFDFIPSQDSPVKPKKPKRKPRNSKREKRAPTPHSKVKSPKRDLAAINSDWGITVDDVDKGHKDEESPTAAVLSQASKMRRHLQEVEESPLLVESVNPERKRRHCRFVDDKVKSTEKLSLPAADDDSNLKSVDKQSLSDTNNGCFSDVEVKPKRKELEESMTEYIAQHGDVEATTHTAAQNTEVLTPITDRSTEATAYKTAQDTDEAQHAKDARLSRAATRLRSCKLSNSSKSSKPVISSNTTQCPELTELSNTAQLVKPCSVLCSKTGTSSNVANISPSPLIRPRRRSLRATLDISDSVESADPSPLRQKTEVGHSSERYDSQKSCTSEVTKSEKNVSTTMDLHNVASPLVFCCSGLSKSDRLKVSQCCKLIGAKFLQDFTPEVTHLIAAVNEENLCARTVKYLLSVLQRCWIVTPLWIDICAEYGKHVDEEAFQVPGCTVSSNVNVTSLSRSTKLNKEPNLLEGCEVFLRGEFISPSPTRHDLERLLRTGGAKTLRREPKSCIETRPHYARKGTALYNTGTIILCMEQKSVHTPTGVVYASPTWLLDCIAQYKLLDVIPESNRKYKSNK